MPMATATLLNRGRCDRETSKKVTVERDNGLNLLWLKYLTNENFTKT